MINHDAVYALYPNVTSITERSALGLIEIKDADGNDVAIDRDAVDAWVSPTKYQRDRAKEYPSIQEQLDMQYWDSVNGTTTWADAIAQVKADYPKAGE